MSMNPARQRLTSRGVRAPLPHDGRCFRAPPALRYLPVVQKTFPQIKSVYETPSNVYENILFPLTDGIKEMQMVVSLKEGYESNGQALISSFEKNITLALIDEEWKEHLREMDDLRTSVQQAVYEQKDPLIVYKLESFELFKSMLGRLNLQTVEALVKMDIPVEQERCLLYKSTLPTNREV